MAIGCNGRAGAAVVSLSRRNSRAAARAGIRFLIRKAGVKDKIDVCSLCIFWGAGVAYLFLFLRAVSFAVMTLIGMKYAGVQGYAPLLSAALVAILILFSAFPRLAYGIAVMSAVAGIASVGFIENGNIVTTTMKWASVILEHSKIKE